MSPSPGPPVEGRCRLAKCSGLPDPHAGGKDRAAAHDHLQAGEREADAFKFKLPGSEDRGTILPTSPRSEPSKRCRMSLYKKPPIIGAVTLLASILLGAAIYQREFRGLILVGFLAGGLVLGAALALLFWAAAEAEAELNVKKENVAAAEADPGRDTFSMARLSMAKLDEYYVLNKSQAKWSFLASLFAVTAGFVVLIYAIQNASGSSVKIVAGSVAGVLMQFIAAGFFYIYNKSLAQMVLFYTNLTRLQDTMLAVQLCAEVKDEQVRTSVMSDLIRDVMRRAMRVGSFEVPYAPPQQDGNFRAAAGDYARSNGKQGNGAASPAGRTAKEQVDPSAGAAQA
jgi:hypothetical protein